MSRPAELSTVTLGEMNKRKKGKNMVTESFSDVPNPPKHGRLWDQEQGVCGVGLVCGSCMWVLYVGWVLYARGSLGLDVGHAWDI